MLPFKSRYLSNTQRKIKWKNIDYHNFLKNKEAYGTGKYDLAGNTEQIQKDMFKSDGEIVRMNYTYLDIPKLHASSSDTIELIKALARSTNLTLLDKDSV